LPVTLLPVARYFNALAITHQRNVNDELNCLASAGYGWMRRGLPIRVDFISIEK